MSEHDQAQPESQPAATASAQAPAKRYGIRITLTANNPMRHTHLLGDDWEAFHWYASTAERDEAFRDMTRQLPNYRQGDTVGQVFEKVDTSG
jgi:hypothetical protein